MIKFTDPSIALPLPWEKDPAIDPERSDLQAFRADPSTAAHTMVARVGDCLTIYHCRPLTAAEYQKAIQQAAVNMPKGANHVITVAAQALCALPLSLEYIENFDAPGDEVRGEGLADALKRTRWNVQFEIGTKILQMSDAAGDSSPLNTVAGRFFDVSSAGEALLTALAPLEQDEDSPLTREQFEAIEKMRETLRPSLKTVDPKNEPEGADLGK